jgi:hypothetical protein
MFAKIARRCSVPDAGGRDDRGLDQVEHRRRGRREQHLHGDEPQVGIARDGREPSPDAAAQARVAVRVAVRRGRQRSAQQHVHADDHALEQHDADEQQVRQADARAELADQQRPGDEARAAAAGDVAEEPPPLIAPEDVGHQAPEGADDDQVERRVPGEEGVSRLAAPEVEAQREVEEQQARGDRVHDERHDAPARRARDEAGVERHDDERDQEGAHEHRGQLVEPGLETPGLAHRAQERDRAHEQEEGQDREAQRAPLAGADARPEAHAGQRSRAESV